MKHFAIFCFIILSQFAMAYSTSDLLGHWKFSEMIYRGHRIPMPNPELNLTWTFFSNGTERLSWDRGTADFCERFSFFSVKDKNLESEVFALNPRNAGECSQDPDMQIGRKTTIKIEKINDELNFYFQMGDEDLIYVLKRL